MERVSLFLHVASVTHLKFATNDFLMLTKYFEGHLMVLPRAVDSKVLKITISLSILYVCVGGFWCGGGCVWGVSEVCVCVIMKQTGNVIIEILDGFFFWYQSCVPTLQRRQYFLIGKYSVSGSITHNALCDYFPTFKTTV